jgi:hypothetical protein
MAKDAAATLTAKIKRLIVGFSLGGFVGFGLLAAGHHVGTTTQANASSARPTSAQFFGLSGGGSSPEKPQVTAPQPTEASPPPVSVSNVS